ncbi:MAG: penicillin-binding transpeptidase domain-containing protein, partial [Patescibacteria group bacterium]
TTYLNVVRGGAFEEISLGNSENIEYIDAPRGIIKDRFGEEVVGNTTGFDLVIYGNKLPTANKEFEDVAKKTSELTGLTKDRVYVFMKDTQTKRLREAVLIHNMDAQKALVFQSITLPGIRARERYVRDYLYPEAFASITGYVGLANEDDIKKWKNIQNNGYVGRAGVEQYYEMMLRGERGKRIMKRDGRVSEGVVFLEPKQGSDITLTIDGELQKYMYERLVEARHTLRTDGAVGMVMDVRNGEMLSLVSLPGYNPSWFLDSAYKDKIKEVFNDKLHPLFNRAISGTYSPASTIKPLVGFAALREGVITPTTIVAGHEGVLVVPNLYHPDQPSLFRDWKIHGDLDVRNAIAESGNIFFYAVGGGAYGIKGLGATKMKQYWELFHLGEKTGIDLPEETRGFLPSPEWKEESKKGVWRVGDTYNISIGQGDLLLTPIQIMRYISAIANKGLMAQPHIVKNSIREMLVPLETKQNEDERWFNIIQSGMKATVESPRGTAHLLSDIPISIAAKTGSSQINWNTKTNALFVGFTPVEKPEIAIIILIENAQSSLLNAVPVAKDVLSWYNSNRGLAGQKK